MSAQPDYLHKPTLQWVLTCTRQLAAEIENDAANQNGRAAQELLRVQAAVLSDHVTFLREAIALAPEPEA